MEKNLISIIVPVYNAEKYLRRCIDSILQQTERNFEVVLIDDGSVDSSGIICDEVSQKDKRFHVIHKANEGVSQARNNGLEIAKGEFITFIDSDDYVEPDFLEILKKHLDMETDMVICKALDEDCNGNPMGYMRNKVFIEGAKRLKIDESYQYDGYYSHTVCWGVLYRAEIIGDVRFKSEFFVAEDTLFFATILQKSSVVVFITNQMYHYVCYEESACHGKIDEKKLTELDAWRSVADLYQPDSITGKSIIRCYARVLVRLYLRAVEDKNINIQNHLRNTLNLTYHDIRQCFTKGMKDKMVIFSVAKCPFIYLFYRRAFRKK